MLVKIRVYDRMKYHADAEQVAEARYEIERFEILNGEQINIESFGDDVDEHDEYLVLYLSNGESSTFRNSYVDLFIEHNEPNSTTGKEVNIMTATMQINTEFNGIEITFADRPNAQTRAELKAHGFRWHSVKKLWYAKQSPDRLAFAQTLTGSTDEPLKAEPKQDPAKLTNKFGVGVGDIFYASWGYEQTNADFFQVVELVGKASVRVREVYLQRIAEDPVSPMSADRTYKITRELLPPAPHSVFIKDNEKGDLKRLKSYAKDGISNPQFYLSSFCDAHLVTSDKLTAYESWYY